MNSIFFGLVVILYIFSYLIKLIPRLSKIDPLIILKKKYKYLINIRSNKFLKKIFYFFFFLISLKVTKMKLNSSSLSFSLFVCKVLNSRVETRAPAAGQIFPPPFLSELDAQFPCNAIRPTTTPLPFTMNMHTFFADVCFATQQLIHSILGYTVIFRLRIQNRGNSKGTTKSDILHGFDRHVRYQGMSISVSMYFPPTLRCILVSCQSFL